MIAPDTNVIVRYLTGDDAAQLALADELIRRQEVLLMTVVLLEAEWVLRSAYEFSATEINRAFRALLGLPTVRTEQPVIIRAALDAHADGMDFADAVLVATSKARKVDFQTFDRALAKLAVRRNERHVHLIAEPRKPR